MADIKPALTAEEWVHWLRGYDGYGWPGEREGMRAEGGMDDEDIANACAREVARYNAALPDGDPRKLTWDMVREIQVVAMALDLGGLTGTPGGGATLNAVAGAIASYLPPE